MLDFLDLIVSERMPFSFNFVLEDTEEGKGSKRPIDTVEDEIICKKAASFLYLCTRYFFSFT